MVKYMGEVFKEEEIIYLRKSRQDNKHENIEEVLNRHEQQLQKQAKEELGHYIDECCIYREVVSGEGIDERIEFQKVLDKIDSGVVKVIRVVDPARLTRGDLEDVGKVINSLRYSGCLVKTLTYTYDCTNKHDRKMLEIELMRGNDFLEYIKETMQRGKDLNLENGYFIGSEAPYGYDKERLKLEKAFKLIINEEEAEIVRMIFNLYIEGLGTINLANHLNSTKVPTRHGEIWKPAYVRSILMDTTYIGLLTWRKRIVKYEKRNGKKVKKEVKNPTPIIVKGKYEPLISMEQFEAVQHKLHSHPTSKVPRTAELKNPLASLVRCGKCGYAMVRKGYSDKEAESETRVHKLDKQALIDFLQVEKKRSGLSLKKIAERTGISKPKIDSWLSSNPDRVYFSKAFAESWYLLKDTLEIKTDVWDEIITKYERKKINDSLICSGMYCDNVSSLLPLVESAILESLEAELKTFNTFVSNYEVEIIKEAKISHRTLKQIDIRIEKLTKAKKNNLRSYNMEDISREEYLEEKREIENELEELEKEKEKIQQTSQEDRITKIKKAIPILEQCIKEYHTLESIVDKNELLKSIIEKVTYTKNVRLRAKQDNFNLHLQLRI